MAAGLFSPTTALNLGTSGLAWYLYLSQQSQVLNLTLGTTKSKADLTFTNLEIPEKFGPLAGRHEVVKHEYPGGAIDVQAMGPFPDTIEWDGILMGDVNGASPFERALIMDNYRVTGTPLYLSYGGVWQWHGVLSVWKAIVRHQNHIEYHAEFSPDIDVTEANNQASLTAAQQAAQTPEGLLSKLRTSVVSALTAAGLDPATLTALGGFLSAIDSALLPATGIISAIAPTALSTIGASYISAASALSTFKPQAAGPALANAATATALLGTVTSMNNLVNQNVGSTTTTIRTVNAHLPTLAQQYYGDASQWTKIAKANGLVDPQQVGIQTLVIPNSVTS